MSILIKGVEMPTSCRACHLVINCDDCEGWECFCVPLRQQIGYLDDLLTDKRRDDCPVIPVPEHGRLIDADALKAKGADVRDTWADCDGREDTVIGFSLDMLDHAPTIIPAEEGEE